MNLSNPIKDLFSRRIQNPLRDILDNAMIANLSQDTFSICDDNLFVSLTSMRDFEREIYYGAYESTFK